jgi:hypothetical protein
VTGRDGSLYFIPENGYQVMRVTPPKEPPKIVEGKLPDGDVLIELMSLFLQVTKLPIYFND